MPMRVDNPLFEGERLTQRLSEALIAAGFTRSRNECAFKRTSEFLAIYRLSCMRRPEDETFLPIPRRERVVKKRR